MIFQADHCARPGGEHCRATGISRRGTAPQRSVAIRLPVWRKPLGNRAEETARASRSASRNGGRFGLRSGGLPRRGRSSCERDGQVSRSGWRMPWGQEPMKGAAHSEMLRGAASTLGSEDARMRQRPHRCGWGPRFDEGGTGGTETSKYPEEEKSTEIPLVAASERGTA